MKELNWKHIRKTVAFTTLVWPIFILAYAVILAVVLSTAFNSLTIFLAVCFLLGVMTPAFVIGGATPDLKKKVLHGFISTGSALPTAALLGLLLFSAVNSYLSPPGDWKLIWRFERNRTLFDEFRDAAQTENGLDYKAMNRLGISSVSHRKNPEGIYFALDKDGFNTIKYYVYRQTPPPSRLIVKKISGSDYGVYRPLGNGWYLYAKAISD